MNTVSDNRVVISANPKRLSIHADIGAADVKTTDGYVVSAVIPNRPG